MLDKSSEVSRERARRKVGDTCLDGGNHVGEWQRIARGSLVAALLLGGLAGCGGSDDGSSSTDGSAPPVATTPPTSQTIALDGFRAVHPGVTTRIDLSTFVRGTGATLSAMSSEQAGCSASNLDGLSADVISDSGLCEFTYKVTSQGGDASATLNTLASDKASPVIPPVSQTMTLAEPSKAFDLEALLTAEGAWPAGYSLDPSSLVVQGGSAQGTATASGNVLTYTHPGEAVWNRILFTLTDPTKPGEDAFGALYVTVSDSANQPPAIGTPKYDYNAHNGSVVTFQTVTLDLATLPLLDITEPDGEEWQLVEVKSYDATVMLVEPDSVTNKQFTFQTGTVGDHIVSYVVGDHEAGFAMGLIKITVGVLEHAKTWSNIIIGDKAFQATPLYSEVTNHGVLAEAVYDYGVDNTVGGVTGSAAKSYCSNGNHLATLEELELLRTTPEAVEERSKYPIERTYVTYDDVGQPLTYHLDTGVTAPYDPVSSPTQYVICVNDTVMFYTVGLPGDYGSNTGLSDGTWQTMGTLTSNGGANDPVVVSNTSIGATPLGEANVRLEPAGCPLGVCNVQVQGDSMEYGEMVVEVTNAANASKIVTIGPLKLLQNAKISAARPGTNNSFANGFTANTVIVSVTDNNNAPLANTAVKLKYSVSPMDSITITPGSCNDPINCAVLTTDANGEVTLSLNSTVAGDYVINLPRDALVGGLPIEPNGFSITSSFVPVCAGGVCFDTPTGNGWMTWWDANNHCIGTGARLPTKDELVALYTAYPDNQVFTVHGWPTDRLYWSGTTGDYASEYYAVSLSNGTFDSLLGQYTFAVTCVR